LVDYDLHSLHQKFGYVPQEPALFSDTIEGNIGYSVDEYTQIELDIATRNSNALEFIKNTKQFPEGYKTMLGDRGLNLSGG
jgi:ABC-type multidrug transport system fused ATPase/permease subunit